MKLIADYETYVEVSTSTKNKNILLDSDDYMRLVKLGIQTLTLSYNSKSKRFSGAVFHLIDKSIYLHRYVSQCPPNLYVDHINRNTLDNRKENLRNVTARENLSNCSYNNKHVGTFYYTSTRKWMAHITIKGKRKHLGYFSTELEAAAAYNKAKQLA